MSNTPNPAYFDEYAQWLRLQGISEGTIQNYLYELPKIPKETEDYFANPKLKAKKMKIFAYRSYLKFLCKKRKEIDRGDLADLLDYFKSPVKRGNGQSNSKWSVPKKEWEDYIRLAPNQIAKMGVWLGFQFGLRLGEILHLRIQDIDFKQQEIIIREHKKTKYQEAWHPKYKRERQVPFTEHQGCIIKRWIDDIRPNLDHSYLLWTPKNKHKGRILGARTFQRWCRYISERMGSVKPFHPHILRYSFATHYYNESKDVKLVGDLLGHANVSTTSEYLQLGQKETMSKARQLFTVV